MNQVLGSLADITSIYFRVGRSNASAYTFEADDPKCRIVPFGLGVDLIQTICHNFLFGFDPSHTAFAIMCASESVRLVGRPLGSWVSADTIFFHECFSFIPGRNSSMLIIRATTKLWVPANVRVVSFKPTKNLYTCSRSLKACCAWL